MESRHRARCSSNIRTPEGDPVAINSRRRGCSCSSRSEAEVEGDECLQITAKQDRATDIPVHGQLGRTVVRASNSDKSVQVVQSELSQADRQTEAVLMSEFCQP